MIRKLRVEQIQKCYEGFGPLTKIGSSNLKYHLCPLWRNSTMSPIFLAQKRISANDLSSVEKHFKDHKCRAPFDSKKPYISIFKTGLRNPRTHQVFKENSWQLEKKGQVRLVVWTSPERVQVPNGYSFRVGGYFDRSMRRDFLRLQNLNFGIDRELSNELDKLHRKIHRKVRMVIIYNRNSLAVAAGLVALGSEGNYLYCGSVRKEYRKKGLWRLLVAARQQLSKQINKKSVWVMTTRNPILMKAGDYSMQYETFFKT